MIQILVLDYILILITIPLLLQQKPRVRNGLIRPGQPCFSASFLGNADFRKRFVDKFNVYIYSTFNPVRVNAVIDSLRDNIAAEMPYHFLRWGGSMSAWEYNLDVDRDFGNRRPDLYDAVSGRLFWIIVSGIPDCEFQYQGK